MTVDNTPKFIFLVLCIVNVVFASVVISSLLINSDTLLHTKNTHFRTPVIIRTIKETIIDSIYEVKFDELNLFGISLRCFTLFLLIPGWVLGIMVYTVYAILRDITMLGIKKDKRR